MSEPRVKLLPHPILSLISVVVWLLLVNDVSAGSIVFGALLGFLIPFVAHEFWEVAPVVRRWGPLIRLVPLFLWDVVVANIAVAVLVLNVARTPRAAWIVIPLDITNDYAILTLGSMITLTPGTVTAKLNPQRTKMLVHVLDTADPAGEVRKIKQRYERPLKEIFE